MSRTNRKEAYNPHQKEKKPARKIHYRKIRKAANRAVRQGEDPMPVAYRTSGWLTH